MWHLRGVSNTGGTSVSESSGSGQHSQKECSDDAAEHPRSRSTVAGGARKADGECGAVDDASVPCAA